MIIGVDPSSRKVAFAVFDDLGLHSVLKEDAPKKMVERPAVCNFFYEWVVGIVTALDLEPNDDVTVFIEDPIVGRGGAKPTIGQSQVQGALCVALFQLGITSVYPVHHTRWKKEVVGLGNASKDVVRGWLESTHPDLATTADGDQDVIDAICVGLYGAGVLARAGQLTL